MCVCISVCGCVLHVCAWNSHYRQDFVLYKFFNFFSSFFWDDGVVEEGCLACEDYAEGLMTHCLPAFLYFEWRAACAYQFPSFEPRIRSTMAQRAEMPW